MKKYYILYFILLILIYVNGCSGQAQTQVNKNNSVSENEKSSYKVTFIELGSVRCIPCQQMQPIMKSIEQKYPDQVKVVFYDVWTEAGAPYAKKYGIQAIPTQIFLDENGKEYFRHVGFFPEEELVKVLQLKGVK